MNHFEKYFRLFIFVLSIKTCLGQQTKKSPSDFIKAKEHPVWTFHSSFLDSCYENHHELEICDSLLIFKPQRWEKNENVARDKFYVLSAKTGKLLWTGPSEWPWYFSLLPNGSLIHAEGSTIKTFDLYTDKLKWVFTAPDSIVIGKMMDDTIPVELSININNDTLYVMKQFTSRFEGDEGANSELYLLNASTGKVLKHLTNFPGNEKARSVQYIYRDKVVLSSYNTLSCLDISNMNVPWSLNRHIQGEFIPDDKSLMYQFSHGIGNKIFLEKYVASANYGDSLIYTIIDINSGKELKSLFINNVSGNISWFMWQFQFLDSNFFYRPTPNGDGSASEIKFYSVDGFKKNWTSFSSSGDSTHFDYGGEPIIIADMQKLFILNPETKLACLDEKTGKPYWSEKFKYSVYNFNLTRDFIFLSFLCRTKTKSGNDSIIYMPSQILDRNSPDNTSAYYTGFSVLKEDPKDKSIYIMDYKNKCLSKISLQ